MKRAIFLTALLWTATAFSQDTVRHHLTLGYTTNGQIANMVDRFYFQQEEELNIRQSIFKIAAAYTFTSRSNIEYGLQLGFGRRHDRYIHETHSTDAGQQYYSAMPFVLRTWELGRINIATGGGIPFHLVSGYRQDGYDYLGEPFHTTHEGGFITGLSSITQLRFQLAPRLSLVSSMQFGWMYASLGGIYARKPEDPGYNPPWILEENITARKSSLTPPELFFGISFRL